MTELTWIEEHFRDEGIALGKEQGIEQGIAIGEARGKEEGIAIGEARGEERGIAIGKEYAVSAAIEFMRSSGMSHELISSFRNSVK